MPRIWSGISTSSGAEEFYLIVTLNTVKDSNDKLQLQEGWVNSHENVRNFFDIQMCDLHVKTSAHGRQQTIKKDSSNFLYGRYIFLPRDLGVL